MYKVENVCFLPSLIIPLKFWEVVRALVAV